MPIPNRYHCQWCDSWPATKGEWEDHQIKHRAERIRQDVTYLETKLRNQLKASTNG